jgi:hypothetical protein
MATTAPMRETQQEEPEKAIHPPEATIITPVLETPQSQKGKNQHTAGKKSPNQQIPKSSNALHQPDGVSPTTYASATPKEREITDS